ncbi:hypothetical protein Ahy_A04g018361 [Arachis hypogaea]|uniref:Aminotransferase-like plant mobile domain-containing protein n=1 Tax=Arachis hypogaea TaxID=3818 RepID=A0A445DDH2_ARAHY|nr:hypothetical protein Ahy_A04g018361 [Arachis hypogaea]
MAGSSSHTATQDKGKGHAIAPPSPLALRILNQINDEIIDDPHLQINDNRILIPFTIGADTHYFLGPIETLEKANKKLSFFSNAEGEDSLMNQAFNISNIINHKPFRNNQKIKSRGFDFITWYQRLEPTKGASWGTLGIQELLRLSNFSLTTHPWMIGEVTYFWNRTTNNFYLLCGMIGMSLLDLILQSSSESADEGEPTNKDSLAVSSQSEDAANSDPGTQLILRSKIPQSTPHHMIQSIPALRPPLIHTTQVIDLTENPLQQSPERTHPLDSPSLNNQAAPTKENQMVPDSDFASKAADTINSDSLDPRL